MDRAEQALDSGAAAARLEQWAAATQRPLDLPTPTPGRAASVVGHSRGHPQDRRDRTVDVLLGRRPVRDRDPHQPSAVPGRAAEPAGALALDALDDRSVRASLPKPTSTWLRTTSLTTSAPPASSPSAKRRASAQQRSTRSATPSRPSSRRAAQTAKPLARLDDSGHQVAQRRRRPALPGEVGRGVGQRGRRAPGGWAQMAKPQSYGHVEPLVAVARPRVGEARRRRPGVPARGWPPPRGRRRRRRAPTRRGVGPRAQAARRSSHAPVLTLPACRHTIVGPGSRAGQHGGQVGHVDGAVGVGRRPPRRRRAEPDQPQGPVDGRVPLDAGHHPHAAARRARPSRSTSQPSRGQDVVPGRRRG